MHHRIRASMMVGLLAACGSSPSNKTTPAGKVGATEDLRKHLKDDQKTRAPADDKATKRELEVDVKGIKAKLVWNTWDDGPTKVILSTEWHVVVPKIGFTLEPMGSMTPTNAGTPDAAIMTIPTQVRWQDNTVMGTSWGTMTYEIRADGTSRPL